VLAVHHQAKDYKYTDNAFASLRIVLHILVHILDI